MDIVRIIIIHLYIVNCKTKLVSVSNGEI